METLSFNKIADVVVGVVDKVEDIQLTLGEQTGKTIKNLVKFDAVEKAVDTVLDFQREIVEGTNKNIRSVTRTIADGIDGLLGIEKAEQDEETK